MQTTQAAIIIVTVDVVGGETANPCAELPWGRVALHGSRVPAQRCRPRLLAASCLAISPAALISSVFVTSDDVGSTHQTERSQYPPGSRCREHGKQRGISHGSLGGWYGHSHLESSSDVERAATWSPLAKSFLWCLRIGSLRVISQLNETPQPSYATVDDSG